MWETCVRSLGQEDSLEKEMATHFSILAWRIPWTEEPSGLQPMGSQRVGQTEQLHVHFHFYQGCDQMILNAIFLSLQKGQLQMELNLTFCNKMKYLPSCRLRNEYRKGKSGQKTKTKEKNSTSLHLCSEVFQHPCVTRPTAFFFQSVFRKKFIVTVRVY